MMCCNAIAEALGGPLVTKIRFINPIILRAQFHKQKLIPFANSGLRDL